MYFLLELWDGVREFMEFGGMVLWFITALMTAMWTLMFERMWFYKTSLKSELARILETWQARSDRKSKSAHQIRLKLISQVNMRIDQSLPLIKSLIAVAPLLGLLGTTRVLGGLEGVGEGVEHVHAGHFVAIAFNQPVQRRHPGLERECRIVAGEVAGGSSQRLR